MTDRVNVLLHRTVVVDSDLRPGAPLTYFNDGGEGGGGDFFGSDILAKKDFFGSMKDAGIFLGGENNRGFVLVLYFSSAQIKNNISTSYSVVFDQNQS